MPLTTSTSWFSRKLQVFVPDDRETHYLPLRSRKRRPRFVQLQVKLQQLRHTMRHRDCRSAFIWLILLPSCTLSMIALSYLFPVSISSIGLDSPITQAHAEISGALGILSSSHSTENEVYNSFAQPHSPPSSAEEVVQLFEHAPYIPDHSLTAIVPVFVDTLHNLEQLLAPLAMSPSSSLKEIIIVCPDSVAFQARRYLQRYMYTLTTNQPTNHHYPEITLHSMSSLSQLSSKLGSSTLLSLRTISTDWVLILDSSGFEDTEVIVRDFLLKPKELPVPMGPIGVMASHQSLQTTNLSSLDDDHTLSISLASFLELPFVAPALLLKQLSLEQLQAVIFPRASRQISYFPALGALASQQTEFPMLRGIGGLIIKPQSKKTPAASSTPSHASNIAILPQDPLQQQVNATVASIFPERYAPTTETINLALLLGSVQDLQMFSAAACLLQQNFQGSLHVAILLAKKDDDTSMYSSLACGLKLQYLSVSAKEATAEDKLILQWVQAFRASGKFPDVTITSVGKKVEFFLPSNVTVISIPRQDLPYCDWLGSLSLLELKSWNTPEIDISIITQDRPSSLTRLLTSLSNSRFFGDSVNLRVNMEQSSDFHTMNLIHDYSWKHGTFTLNRRVVQAGLLPAVVESWYPRSRDSYGVILEDDIEVSPLFYAWTKMAILRYRYGHERNESSYMFGLSLYQQKQNELHNTGRRTFDARSVIASQGILNSSTPYFSQIPCSWGAVYFPEHWREFHDYLSMRLSQTKLKIDDIIVPQVRSNYWTKSWKKYFIELVFLRSYVMLYPNYPDFTSFSTNHLEVGAHVKEKSILSKDLFLLPLMQLPLVQLQDNTRTGLLDIPNSSLPRMEELPIFNFTGNLKSMEELREVASARRQEVMGCNSTAERSGDFDVLELFCV